MEKTTIRAFDISDFPFADGIYSPRFEPSCIEVLRIENTDFGTWTELIQFETRLGEDIILQGSKVISRSEYLVRNLTQDYTGHLYIIGVEKPDGKTKFLAVSGISLVPGDHLTIEYLSDFEPVDKMRFH